MTCYIDISDLEFLIIGMSLLTYLYMLKDKKEHFIGAVVPMPIQNVDEVNFAKMYTLPTTIYEKIIPQVDYVIDCMKGNVTNDQPEQRNISDVDYIGDKSLAKDGSKAVDPEKFKQLLNTFQGMNSVLLLLEELSPRTYATLFI